MIGNLEDYRWLVGEPAAALLVRLADDLRAKPASPAQIRALRTEAGTARATLLLEQVELRRRAVEKFPQAERMFFTRRGFEQATEVALADYKALAFENAGELADLCCGIGSPAVGRSR